MIIGVEDLHEVADEQVRPRVLPPPNSPAARRHPINSRR